MEKQKDRELTVVDACPRCGGNHGTLLFNRMRRAARDYNFWASCPVTGEPILHIVADPVPKRLAAKAHPKRKRGR
jgi:hypothetical protein